MCEVDYVGDVLEVDVGVAADEGYFFGALQIDFGEARFEILPAHVVLIDFYGWRLIVLCPHDLDDDGAGLHDVLGLLLIGLRNLGGLSLFFVHRHDDHETMISVSSTSISGVMLICGPRAPPPAIDIAMKSSLAHIRHARVCNIRHLGQG